MAKKKLDKRRQVQLEKVTQKIPGVGTKDFKPSKRYTDEQIATAVLACKGNIAAASRMVGCHRSIIDKRKHESELVADAVYVARENSNDEVEEALYSNAVDKKNVVAQIFWLKNRAKDRGWKDVHRNENVNVNVEPQTIKWGDREVEF